MKAPLCLFALFLGTSLSCSTSSLTFQADVSQPTKTWPHYWERCVGSGHAVLALREDFRVQLRKTVKELGFQHIRFHGIFDDDMSVFTDYNGFSWFNVDSIYDFLLSIGMKPIIELSFMPGDMASGNDTIFHYKGNITPPKNYTQWTNLIVEFAKHLIQRYGIEEVSSWYFETWNEPNCGFWSSTQKEYWHLLQVTSAALKSVSSRLRVGGPATCQSAWLSETIDFCKKNNVALDFVSTHEYPTDPNVVQGRHAMKQAISQARKEVGNMPLFYTEFNDGLYGNPPLHDYPFASAFAVFNALDLLGLPDLLSWWTFTDIFEEGGFISTPFNGGFGLQTIHGIAKPSYRAFELLHQSGDELVYVKPYDYPTAGVIVTRKGVNYQILAFNHNIPNATIQKEIVCITVTGLDTSKYTGKATLRMIDDNNSNPLALWNKMGKPQYPTEDQLHQLREASKMVVHPITPSVTPNSISFEVTLIPEAVAAITFIAP